MSLRPKMLPAEKFCWVVVLVAFTVLEVIAIKRGDESAKSDRQARNDEFSRIANRLETAITASKSQYDSTINRVDSVLTTAQGVAETAKTSLDQISGSGSYPCIHPNVLELVDGKISLNMWNTGRNDLTGVAVRILPPHVFKNLEIGDAHKAADDLGTVRPESPKPIPEFISPELDANGEAFYWIDIWTQNGYYVEGLSFRRSKRPAPAENGWAYAYRLRKEQLVGKSGSHGAELIKECQIGWTDEQGAAQR